MTNAFSPCALAPSHKLAGKFGHFQGFRKQIYAFWSPEALPLKLAKSAQGFPNVDNNFPRPTPRFQVTLGVHSALFFFTLHPSIYTVQIVINFAIIFQSF